MTQATGTERLDLPIAGMTCSSCANRVEKRLNRIDGVEATVNFATERASGQLRPRARRRRGAGRGRRGDRLQRPRSRRRRGPPRQRRPDRRRTIHTADLRRRLVFAAALSLPVLLLSMIEPLQFENWQWLALQLATPVVLWAGWPFHRAAWQNLRHGAATMDTLISVGTLAALGLVARRPLLPRRRHAGDDDAVRARHRARRRLRPHLPRGRRRRHHLHPRRPLLRGTGEAAGRRRARGPARPRRQGRRRPRRRGERAPGAGRAPRRRRPLRRPPRREGGDRRRRRGRILGGRPGAADRGVGPGRGRTGGRGRRRRPSTSAAGCVVRATRVGEDTALAQIARLVSEAQTGKAPGPAPRRPGQRRLRPGRHRPRRRHPRLLARQRRRGRSSPSPPRSRC